MKKRLFAIIFALIFCLCTAVPAFAAKPPLINDGAELVDESDETALLLKLNEISQRQQMDIVIVTTEDLHGYATATECADELYEYCGFGYGENKDGILLLVSMADRDWAISTCGYAIDVFTDDGLDYISDTIVPYLSDGDYAAAFDRFAELCDEYCTQAENGEPYDGRNLPREPLSLMWIPISIVIGVVIALIVVACMKAKLKTVRYQAAASSYVKSGSMDVSESSDLFLYMTLSRRARPKDNDSGGSSTHFSSSGTLHGGSSGKF